MGADGGILIRAHPHYQRCMSPAGWPGFGLYRVTLFPLENLGTRRVLGTRAR